MDTTMDLEQQIKEMICECSAVPPEQIELEHNLFTDLGMDSVSAMELIGLLDETFELEIEIEDSVGIKTVQQVVDLARAHVESPT